jgi:hypothetical protein
MTVVPFTQISVRAEQLLDVFADKSAVPPDARLLRMARELCHHNLRQWAAEDECRRSPSDDTTVATAKRAIDRLNAVRVGLIEEIDVLVARACEPDENAALHTETLGMIIDRLSIAWIRVRKLEEPGEPGERNSHLRRLEKARSQLTELSAAYDVLIDELRTGRRTVPNWKILKVYARRQ